MFRDIAITYKHWAFTLRNLDTEEVSVKDLVQLAETELRSMPNTSHLSVYLTSYHLEAMMFVKVPGQNFMPSSRILITDAPLMSFIDPTDESVEVHFTKVEDRGEKRGVQQDNYDDIPFAKRVPAKRGVAKKSKSST
jgi:hypothetical protein